MNQEKQNQKVIDFFEKFKEHFTPTEYKNFKGEVFGVYPFLLTPEHEHYNGYYAVVVGDDTEIKSYEDGETLTIVDFHDEVKDMEKLKDNEVIDFYLGKDEAYSINLHEEKSDYFKKGFKTVVSSLTQMIKV